MEIVTKQVKSSFKSLIDLSKQSIIYVEISAFLNLRRQISSIKIQNWHAMRQLERRKTIGTTYGDVAEWNFTTLVLNARNGSFLYLRIGIYKNRLQLIIRQKVNERVTCRAINVWKSRCKFNSFRCHLFVDGTVHCIVPGFKCLW